LNSFLINVEQPRLEAEAKILIEVRPQMSFPVDLEQIVKGAHLTTVIGALPDVCCTAVTKLAISRVPIV